MTEARAFLERCDNKPDSKAAKTKLLSNIITTMAKRNNKKGEAATAAAKRALRAKHVAFVCADVESHRGSNGRIPRGVMQRVFAEHKEIYHWLTIDLVKKGLKKRKNEEADKIDEAISDLTNPTFEGSTSQESDEPAAPPPMNISISQDEELQPQTSKPKVGRPRGTTIKATMEKEAKKEALIIDTITGIDIFADVIGKETDEDYIANNSGQGKRFPMGPTCSFRGKEVPCVVANTENGPITSELLVAFLEHMDRLELFPRTDPNVKPFLLLDGHGSRLELPFLKYINIEAHQWVVCIGVPYGPTGKLETPLSRMDVTKWL